MAISKKILYGLIIVVYLLLSTYIHQLGFYAGMAMGLRPASGELIILESFFYLIISIVLFLIVGYKYKIACLAGGMGIVLELINWIFYSLVDPKQSAFLKIFPNLDRFVFVLMVIVILVMFCVCFYAYYYFLHLYDYRIKIVNKTIKGNKFLYDFLVYKGFKLIDRYNEELANREELDALIAQNLSGKIKTIDYTQQIRQKFMKQINFDM